MSRVNRVVSLHPISVEIPQLADVAMRRVGKEDELRVIVRAWRVRETPVTIEETEEQFRRGARGASSSRVFGAGELVTPAKIRETVHVALVVVQLDVAGGVKGNLELGLRQVALEIDDIVQTRRVLDLSESIPVFAVVMEVLDRVGGRIENNRLATHVGRLMRTGEEVAELARVRARAQALTIGVVVAGES